MCVLVCPSCVASGTSRLGVRCGGVWLGLGSCRAPPLLAGVLGRVPVCVCAPLVPRFSWGCAGAAVGGVCPSPPLLAFSFWGLYGVGRWLPRSWVSWSLSPHHFSFGPRCLLFFFFRVACVRVFWVFFPLMGRCPRLGVAGFGWVVPWRPFGGSCLRCSLGGGVGRLLWCWWALWWLWDDLAPPLPLFSFLGGLPVPPSAVPGLAHALVGILCGFPVCRWWLRFARLCPGPMGRVGYVHVWLGAPSWRARFRLCRVGGCARRLCVALGLPCPFVSAVPVVTFWRWLVWVDRHRCCRARGGPLPVCGGLVRLLPGSAVA